MFKIIHTVIWVLLLSFLGSAGVASSVSLNGVDIEGITNQRFENCTVEIDAQGKINIVAKGYIAKHQKSANEKSDRKAAVELGKRYWAVFDDLTAGVDEVEIDLFINNKLIRTFFSQEKRIVFEVSEHLARGKNAIEFISRNKKTGVQASDSSDKEFLQVLFGSGYLKGRNVVINKKIFTYRFQAYELQNAKKQYSFLAN